MGGSKKTTTATLARARMKKNELWRLYSLQRLGGWMGMEESVFLES